MSSGKKTLLVIATILVIGGGAISFGAFAAAGFNFENLSTESRNWTSSTKTFAPETENPHTPSSCATWARTCASSRPTATPSR